MSERPIIFSGPMVRALLAGRKTQTRRLISSPLAKCQPGDRLWVRESCIIAPSGFTDSPANPMGPRGQEVDYLAEHLGEICEAAREYGLKGTPAIHMPRWASRLTLAVTEVRTQRLQEISHADAISEGQDIYRTLDGKNYWYFPDPGICRTEAWLAFAALWDSLHAKPGEAWKDNPEIVAISFTVNHCNIDKMERDHG